MIFDFLTSFILGLLTPLTAVCVLPLYPGFLAFLSNRFSGNEERRNLILIGSVVVGGVMVFMLALGLIFTTLLEVSLNKVIGIVSPIAFVVLGIVGIFLIFDFDFGKFLPKVNAPLIRNPLKSAFVFGLLFGAIVIPCNPAFIAAFFARALLSESFVSSMLNFVAFGIGLGFPLLIFSAISARWSNRIIGFLSEHKRKINLISGVIMLGVAVYYLFFVFDIFG